MEISHQILKPLIDRLESECLKFEQELNRYTSEEASQLRSFIQKKMRQLNMLKLSVSYANSLSERPILNDLRDTFRQLKLELRFAQRKWKRVQLGEARMRKNQEKRSRLSTFAA